MSRRFEVGINDPAYPAVLADTSDPPQRLYGIGELGCLRPGLGVVGARKATPYGLAAARIFAGWAAEAGYVVVSGGAFGCDQAAHAAALDAGGQTVSVMAGGADIVYPRSSGALHARIHKAGAVISEHPWGTGPKKWTFRSRNRIIAGLSAVLLILEASLPSGTFSTAEYALDAGRTVAVVPGSIFAPECRGTNRLLRNGAFPITDASELRDLLEAEIGPAKIAGKTAEEDSRPCGQTGVLAVGSGDVLYNAIRADPMRPDDAARQLGRDIVSIARRLGELEAAGLVKRYPDGRYGSC